MSHISAFCIIITISLASCNIPLNISNINADPPIYPDYTNVTIPVNIAPLNFMVRDSSDRIVVLIKGSNDSIIMKGRYKIRIPEKKWKSLLSKEKGHDLVVTVITYTKGNWVAYRPFRWTIKPEKVDPYLSYRLIEPGYEVWNKIQLAERNTETFDERVIADNNLTGGFCINCHVYGNEDGSLSMFHLRGKNGGTILNRKGVLRKINTRNKEMISNAVYGNFHPSGRYAVFSTNIIIPEFHTFRNKRLEVYDKASDLVVIDLDNNKAETQPCIADPASLETFPAFSADGKWIYYCTAKALPLPEDIKSLKYSICKIQFDAANGRIGTKTDTVWNSRTTGYSASFPRMSPNGRFLLFTVSDYGTFPIWHREADLRLINLETGKTDSLAIVNGPCSDSYHSWSSNSHWFVFASKRDDGIYGKPYFCYIDSSGKAGKPFVLPQKDPAIYLNTLKSFNIPELSKSAVPFGASDTEQAWKTLKAEVIN